MQIRGSIQIDETYCKGCGLCIDVCPPQVISLNLNTLTSYGYHPVRLHADGCTGCGICAVVCPDAAITVYRQRRARRRRRLAKEL